MKIREWCEQAQPVYALHGWELYNPETGKMEVPNVDQLEELCWELIDQFQDTVMTFTGAGRIAVTRLFPHVDSGSFELSLMYENIYLSDNERPAKQLTLF